MIDDDAALLDDPEAIAMQSDPRKKSHDHDLIMATMKGGETWRARYDAEEARLRTERLQKLQEERQCIRVRTVGAIAMLETLRQTKAFVVVHLAVADNRECQILNKAMAALDFRIQNNPSDSRFVGKTRPVFLQLDAKDAEGVMHEVDLSLLPTLLIYQNEKLIANKFQVTFHEEEDPEDQLEDILDELGLFGR